MLNGLDRFDGESIFSRVESVTALTPANNMGSWLFYFDGKRLSQVHERRGSVVVVRYLHPSSGASVEKGFPDWKQTKALGAYVHWQDDQYTVRLLVRCHSRAKWDALAGRRASSASEPVRHFAPQPRIVARDDSGATRAYDSSGDASARSAFSLHFDAMLNDQKWGAQADVFGQTTSGSALLALSKSAMRKAGRERLACAKGCSCKEWFSKLPVRLRDRDGAHLHDMAHPFDDDYAYACARSGVHPEVGIQIVILTTHGVGHVIDFHTDLCSWRMH
eukprot:3169712-Amphidinium_carterae.1